MVSLIAPTYSLKGKPHWRRTQQVYSLLNQAPPEATYVRRRRTFGEHLIEYVRGKTGKGCSRKLISRWKKLTILDRTYPPSSPNLTSKPAPQEITPAKTVRVNTEELLVKDEPLVTETPSQSPPVETTLETNQSDINSIQNPKSKIQNPFTERVLQVARNTWSYVAATAIVIGIAGGWFLSKDNSQPVIAQPAAVTTQTAPAPRPQKLEPRTIKIHLTLTSPQDLKVKPGDEVTPGTVLSVRRRRTFGERSTERQRLLSQKKQLQLSLKKLDVPIPELIPPEPIPALSKLPPVSYQQEEANIALKQQELAEAERAVAGGAASLTAYQQEKIKLLSELLIATQSTGFKNSRPDSKVQGRVNFPQLPTPNSNVTSGDNSSGEPQLNALKQAHTSVEQNPKLSTVEIASYTVPNPKPKANNQNIKIIIEHEQAILSQLKAARDKAKLQLDIAKSQLLTARERRAHAEYQRYVEETKRAIALQQQQIELERQRSIRAGQIQEREYSKAQIEAKIQEIDNAISNLSTVKAPYPGKIKKVKWTGQSDHNLTVALTLDVDDGSKQPTVVSQQ